MTLDRTPRQLRKDWVKEREASHRPLTLLDRTAFLAFVVLIAFVFGGVFAVVLNLDRGIDERNPPTLTHIYIITSFDPYSGLDKYFPANFTVPAGADVAFTITNYDNATNPVSDAIAAPSGVRDLQGAATGGAEVSHTFMVPGLNINVPIPAAQDQTPAVVTFTVHVDSAGVYGWMCMAPCDEVSMATPGFMQGTMTVG